MVRPSTQRLSQGSIGVRLLAIVRSLAEYFRLQYLHGEALVIGQVTPYVAGALFAAVALALTVICYFAGLYRVSIAVAVATLILLFVYKMAVMGLTQQFLHRVRQVRPARCTDVYVPNTWLYFLSIFTIGS